ncbi:type VI secretion system membrane subunit TssM [Jannaschia seohaensis]|uniref:Type VI secretion system protein ImpL n=1 Tax=Jannaschia seohaensis TaxID=475081 RepID=A0A2Y9B352_9RHOB|nr:type VI secretion system membrane subunit TssM [Jannaschia seohaensis]PWJ16552.1 type VI secretion system protein ImpL [Jannaschia seohaensis]SSA48789.1 type VI secretion system protein ImpL [Jannaschia seohaensis]
MRVLKKIFGFLFSRFLWTLIGVTLLCLAIWFYGPLLSFGTAQPLASDLARIVTIGVILILWLVSMLIGQMRAAKANRAFVTELAAPLPDEPAVPGAMDEVHGKFAGVMDQMKRSKLGGRKFLRDMPWYVIIGPPGTGKTTALLQSGLNFPIDLSDDLKGVGGTRNCDWFFTEDAVLIDTAGRYVQQQSDPERDATEWRGFLDLLVKHRGRRALNGVILTLSVEELAGDAASIRDHGREIRKRLAELSEQTKLKLPVYLMITKTDLVPGFEAFFGDLNSREREQVWGATLGTAERVDGTTVEREMGVLQKALEERMPGRIAEDMPLSSRAEVFRFPAQVEQLTAPLKVLVESVFGESRYEESPWLRGLYFTSATQEGSPIDRMVSGLAGAVGLRPPPAERRAHGNSRSFFLRELLTDLIFPEAGLGRFDPKAEERRKWVFRGTVATAALTATVLATVFLFSYLRWGGALTDQERQLATLSSRLANVAARQAPTDPLDLDLALDAVNETANAGTPLPDGALTVIGPTAEAELLHLQSVAYEHSLRNILEPRMVALLEATMWRHARDPEFQLGALKAYQMLTGGAPYDAEFLGFWWQTELPAFAPIEPFPTEEAIDHQLAALSRMATEENKIEADPALVSTSLETICTIPLAVRAYRDLMANPAVTGLDDWIPAEHVGPNGARVLTRLSEKTLRLGLPGAFTYAGFHEAILPLLPEVAGQAVLDRAVFTGGCTESAEASEQLLEQDMLKLYQDEFIATWNGMLRDLRLAPLDTFDIARRNMRDLASTDSALRRLLRAVANETYLTRPEPEGGAGDAATDGALRVASKLGKLGKLAKTGARIAGAAGDDGPPPPPPGESVSDYFAPIRSMIEPVDGIGPLIDDAEVALGALSDRLQTVAASPDPAEALLQAGGLSELIGAIVTVSAEMPDPVDEWLAALAGDAESVTTEAVIAELDARWRADVLPFCVSATGGRYPFEPGSRIDVNTLDFARLFGPGGLIDSFIEDQLSSYIDTAIRPWQWRPGLGLEDAQLRPFENARRIRDALFPGGAGPIMAFTLEPKTLSPSAARVTLNVDGQTLSYFNAATRPEAMTWPGPDGTNMITLTFAPVAGGEVITSETGSWAFLRLIRKGSLQATALPEVFGLRLGAGGHSASFDLRANSVENPFDLEMFSGFVCPQGF